MAIPTFDTCVKLALDKYGVCFNLKAEQKSVLESVFNGNDTVAVLPTGFGKSLIFQLIPYMISIKQSSTCPLMTIVITPISAIMEDQMRSLVRNDIKAGHLLLDGTKFKTFELGSDDEIIEHNVTELPESNLSLLYSHPEPLVSNSKMRKLLSSLSNRICCIAIDEVHMISEWYSIIKSSLKYCKQYILTYYN